MYLKDLVLFQALIKNSDIEDACKWCINNLPDGSWMYSGLGTFEFDDESLRTLFLLTWAWPRLTGK